MLLVALAGAVSGRQFRHITPIAAPASSASALPAGATPVAETRPFTRSEIDPLVRDTLAKWNTAEMADTLAESFFDQNRLLDAVDARVPRDAKLTVQGIQGVQTLQQYNVPGSGGERGDVVSIVSATVRTQLEFNDPQSGFVRRPGTSEFILEIRTPAPPSITP